ncbi:MAG TPA: hemolysin family protein [Chlamydiales bacterium]|nr:hemolysin family protein [Chlamydiales bacterium]
MNGAWVSFLCYTVIAIAIQGVFALFEMACISFSKVRLQYYVSLGKKRAIWMQHLLNRPSRLFGTTLIGINAALQIGSEYAREFYASIHLNPDWSPLTQVLLVVIFAELAPLFAARRHPEQVVMALIPFMAALAKVLSPIIWVFNALSHLMHRLMKQPVDAPLFLSREEVKMAFEEKEKGEEDEFNQAAARIFQLKTRTVGAIMTPLARIQMAPTTAIRSDIDHLLKVHYVPFIPIYHHVAHNVVGIVYLRDLLKMDEERRVVDAARSPWFVSQDASILDILDQFRSNNQSVAVILDPSGASFGLVSLDEILAQIFGPEAASAPATTSFLHIERTLSGEMEIAAFNREFQSHLPHADKETLSDLIVKSIDHYPAIGETVKIGPYLFTVIEPKIRGVKILRVDSIRPFSNP